MRTKKGPRSTHDVPRTTARAVLRKLKRAYPGATCALTHRDAFELLSATILSAQCTDARVNLVTPALFARYPDPHALAAARQADVEAIIRSTGFFRNKAKNLIAMAQALVADHGGEVPDTMAALHHLPGVGRKTANVVLGNWYGINEGVTVDTHVTRLTRLLGLTRHTDPVKIERDLMGLVPRKDWTLVSHLLILHGRAVCIANRPKCGECVLAKLCPSSSVRGPESEVRGARAQRSR
ncbi:MAG TPA: endonuclease III [Gemmatimonadales bacterium]|nr:endonuclease III [Gemmatimonadales bacterium]